MCPLLSNSVIVQIIQGINWTNLAIPTGAVIVFWISVKLGTKWAKKQAEMEIQQLHNDLKSETQMHEVARSKLESVQIQLAANRSTLQGQQEEIQRLKGEARNAKRGFNRIWNAGRKLLKELDDLRIIRKNYVVLRQYYMELKRNYEAAIKQNRLTLEERDRIESELKIKQDHLLQLDRRMEQAKKLGGYILKAKALQDRPQFVPLAERKVPIVAVCALKGGVGKTTITAHLAGAFARKDYKILLLDLDLQGSLSGQMLDNETLTTAFMQNRLTQDFFNQFIDDSKVKISDYIFQTKASANIQGLIDMMPTSDRLSYSELNLTMRWLLRTGKKDPRFLLRKALHQKGILSQYDLVLIDCPPVLNMSCVNALSAADYVLIPTILSGKSMERVPKLISALQEEEFIKYINPQLNILGIVANKTRFKELKTHELDIWSVQLPNALKRILKDQIKQFESVIPQDVEIASQEDQFRHLEADGRAFSAILQLALEIEKELPDVCRKADHTAVHSGATST